MKLFVQILVLCCSSVIFKGIHSMCTSPQNVEIGTRAIVECFLPFPFNGVFWSHSSQTGDEVLIRLEKQPSGNLQKSGIGYENGSFDILSNGLLVIKNVSEENDAVFKVIVISDNYTVFKYTVEAVATRYSHQLVPLVNGCGNDSICYISNVAHGILNCTVHGARPAVNLKWFKRSIGGTEELDAAVVTHSNGKYGFTSIASLEVFNFSSPLTILQCKGLGPFLNSNSIEIDVIIENETSYHDSWLGTRVTKRRVALHSHVSIPCTDKETPKIFLWKVRRENSTMVLLFSIFGNAKYMEVANATRHHGDGAIVLITNVQPWQSKEIYTCVYADGNDYAFTKVQLLVLNDTLAKDVRSKAPKSTLAIIFSLLLVILLVAVISITVHTRRKLKKNQAVPKEFTFFKLCEEMADAILHCPFCLKPGTVVFTKDVIEMFRTVSDDNEKNRKKKNIGVAAGSGAGILAGVLVVAGSIFAPATFGASLALTLTGAAVGAGAAGATFGFTIDKNNKDKNLLELVAPVLQSFISLQADLAKIINRLAIIYGMVDVANKLEIEDDEDLIEKRESIANLLIKIKETESDGDVFEKIKSANQYSEHLMRALKEELKRTEQSDRWWESKAEKAEKSPFDTLSEALSDILVERKKGSGSSVKSFVDFTAAIFLPQKIENRSNNLKATVAHGIVAGTGVTAGMMAASGKAALGFASIGDDAARIGGTVARFAQGVSIAGSVLGALGIVVDIAFLGHAIYDLSKVEKDKLSQACTEVADVMENINNIALKFTITPNEDKKTTFKTEIDETQPLSVSVC